MTICVNVPTFLFGGKSEKKKDPVAALMDVTPAAPAKAVASFIPMNWKKSKVFFFNFTSNYTQEDE